MNESIIAGVRTGSTVKQTAGGGVPGLSTYLSQSHYLPLARLRWQPLEAAGTLAAGKLRKKKKKARGRDGKKVKT